MRYKVKQMICRTKVDKVDMIQIFLAMIYTTDRSCDKSLHLLIRIELIILSGLIEEPTHSEKNTLESYCFFLFTIIIFLYLYLTNDEN